MGRFGPESVVGYVTQIRPWRQFAKTPKTLQPAYKLLAIQNPHKAVDKAT